MSRSRSWFVGLLTLAVVLGVAPQLWADAGFPAGRRPAPGGGGGGAAPAALAIGWLACMGFALLLGIAIKIFIIVFIVKDCKKRGIDPTMWVILEIFFGLIGLIVYLCVREGQTQNRQHFRGDRYDDRHDDRGPRINNDWDRDRERDRRQSDNDW